jgi:hypothetical protein
MTTQPTVAATADTVLSYPMAHNRVPFLREIRLDAFDPALGTVDVSVSVVDRDQTVTKPLQVVVDVTTGAGLVREPNLLLDPARMSRIEERRPAELVVAVTSDDVLVTEQRLPVELLAARQFVRNPRRSNLSHEMLASFVMPNDPAIPRLLAEAREILTKKTGSASTEGYQADEKRVDAIVEAIYEAARARGIAYSEPPPSWDLGDFDPDDPRFDEPTVVGGQKVRTPTDVFDGRVGTCLDTTVALASALEHVGINSVLWLVHGHAFLGYWRTDQLLPSTADTELSLVKNEIDLDHMRTVETTLLTEDGAGGAFDNPAHARRRDLFLTGDLSKAICAVDVRRARRNDILPLPAHYVDDDGASHVVEYVPTTHSGVHRVTAGTARSPSDGDAGPAAPPRVQSWKNSLLDLSLRNRLINFTDRSAISLAVPSGSIGHVEDRLTAGQSITLQPSDLLAAIHHDRGVSFGAQLGADELKRQLDDGAVYTNVTDARYLNQLRNLAYKARTVVEETGANNLYIALGSLHWSIDGRALKSPLILLPINLVSGGRSRSYRIVLDESGASTPNYCLMEKLHQVDELRIPGLENPVEDEFGIDLDAAFRAVREAVAAKGLPYRVEETADVAILQFAKFRLWKDLDEHWAALMDSPMVTHLVETPTAEFVDPMSDAPLADLDDLDASCPIPADASQLEAVASAVAGRTFVLEGPPGTGKSQTITNLLTRAVADGKRVLFVAEKRAALDVVSSRLDSVGLGPFSLNLHDKASKPSVVRDQIKQALDLALTVDKQGLAALREDLHTSRRALSRYASRLHEPNGSGLSFYSSRTQALTLGGDADPLPVEARHISALDSTIIDSLKHALRTLPDVADPARPRRHHPWGFIRRALADDATSTVLDAARRYDAALMALPPAGPLRTVVDAATGPRELTSLASFVGAPAVSLDDLDAVRTRSWADARDRYLQSLDTFASGTHPGLDRVRPEALDLPLPDVRSAVATAAASGFFGRKKRILQAFAPVGALAHAPIKHKQALETIDALLETRTRADQVAPGLSQVRGLRTPAEWNPFSDASRDHLTRQIAWLEHAAATVAEQPGVDTPDFTVALRGFIAADQVLDRTDEQKIRELASSAEALWAAAGADESDVAAWLDGERLADTWAATTAGRDLDTPSSPSLPRWLRFVRGVEPLREVGLVEAADVLISGDIGSDDAVRSFELGLALASLDERRVSTGLDAFDASSHGKSVGRFTTSIDAIREALKAAVPAEIVQQRPFSSQASRGQVGELRRELSKQRRGLKVRALMEQYGDLITQLMPCVLVSPDSVARFFPVGSQTFDLVVFDEASQIRVADSIGAMGRARSVVVVGDSKQMPPTSFAEPGDPGSESSSDSSELSAVEDEESILTEAVQAGVDRLWLSWHYRSKDESLIAFSNAFYYENKLSSFPAPSAEVDHAGRPVAGVSLERVDGQFLRGAQGKALRTNPVEADAIVREIRERFASSPDDVPSIGVVTFNVQQRTLIEELLRDADDPRILEALDGTNGEGLFVKNLENVQGDERDVILFSTAFSKNDKGVLPLNFGPLGNTGGERRLNVAVTRARRKVVIFSSFDPSDIRVDDTQSKGIKHLRAYMEMAASGPEALVSSGAEARTAVDRHRDEIAEALRARGAVVHTDLGLSDFRIDLTIADTSSPDEPLVAVLLDGEGWAARRTVGDRDGLPVSVLGNLMGWRRIERVWMPEWIEDAEGVVVRLLTALDEARSAPVSVRVGPPVADHPLANPQPAPFASSVAAAPVPEAPGAPAAPSGASEFVPWRDRVAGGRAVLDQLPGSRARAQVTAVMREIVEAEGPVQLERLVRLTAGAFGLTRLSAGRIESIAQCVPSGMRDGAGFVWTEGVDRAGWRTFRTASSSAPRPMDEIHPLELANAMVALCRDAYGMSEDELLRETLAVFGWKRRTESLVAPIKSALSASITDGLLVVQPNGVITAGQS